MAVLVHLHAVEQRHAIEYDSLYREPPYWPPPNPHIPVEEDHSLRPMWNIIGFIGAIMVVAGLYSFNGSSNSTVASATDTNAPATAGSTHSQN